MSHDAWVMAATADLAGRTFAFFRIDGTLLAPQMRLQANGLVEGSSDQNETYWEFQDGKLVFLNAGRRPTTRFQSLLVNSGALLIVGAYLPQSDTAPWHVLWDNRLASPSRNSSWQFDRLHDRLHDLRASINLMARKIEVPDRPIRVIFLVHAVEVWDTLADVHAAMCRSDDFKPVVASIPRRYPGEHEFGGEDRTHEALLELGVRHLRLGMREPHEALDILKALQPDIIFRQSPWEIDVPDAFGTHDIGFARLCYIPYYGFNLLARFATADDHQTNYYADQTLHRMCWRIFCETEATKALMRSNSALAAANVVVTGHPKLDRLYAARDRPAWPIEGQPQNYRLIWAPHHSIGDDWLGFGTFVETHAAMLRWAQEDGEVDFVLKPHPALFTRIRGERPDLAPGLEQFLTEWGGLPNTALVEGGDYGALLAASDAMVTDGISFLAEYQLFDKPLVFLDSGRHVPFNDVGQLVATGAWTVGSVDAARSVLAALRAGETDALASTRQAILNELLPFPGRSADRVLDEIRRGLLAGG